MVVISKRNVIFHGVAGVEPYALKRGDITVVPSWVSNTQLFKDLVSDGLIAVSDSHSDNVIETKVAIADKAETKSRKRARSAVKDE